MPLSENTILHHYTLIGNILNKAVEWEYISKNPNTKIEKPKLRKHIPKYYNIEQLEKLKKALEKESLKTRTLLTLAIDSGARRGELTGLDWDDIDFINCTININKTTQTVNGKIIEKFPKTDSSIRIVPITKKTIELLELYRAEQLETEKLLGKKWTKTKKVFTSAFGGPMSPRMPSDILERVLEKNNLPKICFHELRHTSVSLLINSGIDAQIVSKRVGHSSVSTTTNIYSHIFQSTELKAVKAMTEILK